MKRIIHIPRLACAGVLSGLAVAVTVLFAAGCGRPRPVSLQVDFTTRELWPYRLTAVVGGSARLPDSSLSFADTVHTLLRGRPAADARTLVLGAHDVQLRSSAMDPVESEAIRHRLEGTELTVSLREGFVTVDSSSVQPPLPPGKLDLYRHLVRVLPVLPRPKARPGFSWDREIRLPLRTNHGPATAHLYQAFTFDSVHTGAEGTRQAHLSWRFRYTILPADTTGELDRVPRRGTGNGSAIIDLDGRFLRHAAARLLVPPRDNDPVGIAWREEVTLSLVSLPPAGHTAASPSTRKPQGAQP
jgi:hypothetical protein